MISKVLLIAVGVINGLDAEALLFAGLSFFTAASLA